LFVSVVLVEALISLVALLSKPTIRLARNRHANERNDGGQERPDEPNHRRQLTHEAAHPMPRAEQQQPGHRRHDDHEADPAKNHFLSSEFISYLADDSATRPACK
jgi:hypothetical protein